MLTRARFRMLYTGMSAANAIQYLVFIVILCPIFILYISGPYIPIWLAAWRLKSHDYASTDDGDTSIANLKVALDVLYILAVAQGALFYYMTICALAGKALVKLVILQYNFSAQASTSVWGYLEDTRKGCSKDPSFARGRNLVTYAVHLIKSESAERNLSGIRILDTVILLQATSQGVIPSSWNRDQLIAQHMVIKQIGPAASSGEIMQKLLQMLDSISPYSKEMRKRAARIVAYLAGDIHLEQFPRGIEYIASLLDTFEEHNLLEPYQRDWLHNNPEHDDWYKEARHLRPGVSSANRLEEDNDVTPFDGYKLLVLQGLLILEKVAAHESSCIIISNTKGLLSKIMAPISTDLLHSTDHGILSMSLTEGSLRVMCQLASAPGEIGSKLRLQMFNHIGVMSATERILKCPECGGRIHEKAMEMLTQLYMDTSLRLDPSSSRESFINMLLDIFLKVNYTMDMDRCRENYEANQDIMRDVTLIANRAQDFTLQNCFTGDMIAEIDRFLASCKEHDMAEAAAVALVWLSSEMESSAAIILKCDGIMESLIGLLLNDNDNTYRPVVAAVLLERLCINYTRDDEYLTKVKKVLTDVMPKVLREILHASSLEEIQIGAETNQMGSSAPEMEDIENQCGEPINNGPRDRCTSSNEIEGEEEMVILPNQKRHNDENFMGRFTIVALSLCVTVCDTCIAQGEDLARHFGSLSVPRLLMGIVRRNCVATADCLGVVKLISRMFISMMRHEGSYDQQSLHEMMDALSIASSVMLYLDISMIFEDHDSTHGVLDRLSNHGRDKPTRTLKSLVEEARQLMNEKVATTVGFFTASTSQTHH